MTGAGGGADSGTGRGGGGADMGRGGGSGRALERLDPGAQPERTRLAWRRTTLAGVAVVALAWRHAAYREDAPVGYLAAGAVTLIWVALVVAAQRRIRRLAGPPAIVRGYTVLSTAACTLALVGCSAVLIR